MTTFSEANVSTPTRMIESLRGDYPGTSIERCYSILEKAVEVSDFAGSVGNCHVDGLYSIVLFSEPGEGMIRFYYQPNFGGKLSSLTDDEGNFTIGVHNHHYDIAKVSLTGRFTNVRFHKKVTYGKAPMVLHEHEFHSALRGEKMRVEHVRKVGFELPEIEVLKPGEATVMAADDLHTVVTGKVGATAWMVFEGPHRDDITPLIYSTNKRFKVSSDGLYQPVSASVASTFTKAMLSYIKESR